MTYILTLPIIFCLNSDATDTLLLSQHSIQTLNTKFGGKLNKLHTKLLQNCNFVHICGQWHDSINAWRSHTWTVIFFRQVLDEN